MYILFFLVYSLFIYPLFLFISILFFCYIRLTPQLEACWALMVAQGSMTVFELWVGEQVLPPERLIKPRNSNQILKLDLALKPDL